MESLHIKAVQREKGKGGAGRLRRNGLIPAVLYGDKGQLQVLAVNNKDLNQIIHRSGAAMNTLFRLSVEGEKNKDFTVIIKDFQVDLISREFQHLDFMVVDLKKKVIVSVPIVLTGKAQGEAKGGIVDHTMRQIEIRCEAGQIPDRIEVDISGLDVGQSIHTRELTLSEGVSLKQDINQSVASVVLPRAEVVAAPTEAVAPEAAVAEEGKTEEGAEGKAGGKIEGKAGGKVEGKAGGKPEGKKES